jgi:hypothetical protein
MRATRAYLASLGTTGLLLLAALTVGVIAGTLIGFDAWPGQDEPAEVDRVVIDPATDQAGSGPEQVAALAAGAADDVAGDPVADGAASGGGAGPAPAGEPPGARGRERQVPRQRQPAPGPEQPTGTPPQETPPTTQPTEPEPPAQPSRPAAPSLTDGLADGLESVTTFLGDKTLAPLSPELGRLVTGVGQVLTDVVRALDGTPPQR